MDCKVFVDRYIEALKEERLVVIFMSNGVRIDVYPKPGLEFQLPFDSGLVSPYVPEGIDCKFITRGEEYGDYKSIGIPLGRYTITLHGSDPETPDSWLTLDPEQISMIYLGGGLPPHMSRL